MAEVVDDTPGILVLDSACTVTAFSFSDYTHIPPTGKSNWERTQLGQLTSTGQRDIPSHTKTYIIQ